MAAAAPPRSAAADADTSSRGCLGTGGASAKQGAGVAGGPWQVAVATCTASGGRAAFRSGPNDLHQTVLFSSLPLSSPSCHKTEELELRLFSISPFPCTFH
jgi:hypothetical protein